MGKKLKADIGMNEIRRGIWDKRKKEAAEQREKEKRLLIFKASYDFLNALWDRFKEGYNKITPADSTIYRIGEVYNGYQTCYFILASKEFPLVAEGSIIPEGTVDYDDQHHNIIFKIKE